MLRQTATSLIALLGMFAMRAFAQNCRQPPDLTNLTRCEILAQSADISMSEASRQVEAPAASANSASLADSAASPFLLGASGNPARLASRSYSPNANDFSVTINAYGVYSLAARRNPFDLETYESTSNVRRFSFSYDHSMAVDDLPTDLVGDTDTYLGKMVLYGFRDFAAKGNHGKNARAMDQMLDATAEFGEISVQIAHMLYAKYGTGTFEDFYGSINSSNGRLPALWPKVSNVDKAAIAHYVAKNMEAQLRANAALMAIVNGIKNQLQISADFTSRISYSGGSNLYRTELILEKGSSSTGLSSTTNLSYDFQNAVTPTTFNRQIGRVVEQVTFPVPTSWTWLATPSVAGEADYGSNGTPIYKAQAKAVIPLRSGISAPLTFQFANRTAAGPHADVKGQIGFTFDLEKAVVEWYGRRPWDH
jgi:hypothetical protein